MHSFSDILPRDSFVFLFRYLYLKALLLWSLQSFQIKAFFFYYLFNDCFCSFALPCFQNLSVRWNTHTHTHISLWVCLSCLLYFCTLHISCVVVVGFFVFLFFCFLAWVLGAIISSSYVSSYVSIVSHLLKAASIACLKRTNYWLTFSNTNNKLIHPIDKG